MTQTAEPVSPAPTRRSELLISVVLGAVAFVVVTAETVPVGLIDEIAAGLDVPRSGVGLAVSWYALFTAATGVPMTRLVSRLDRRTVLIACSVLVVAAQLVAAAAPNLAVFMAGRGLAALGHGVFFSVAAPVLMRLARPEARDRVGGRVAVGGSVALVAGTPLVTLAGQLVGWRGATAGTAAVALALAMALRFVLPPLPARHDAEEGSAGVLATLRHPHVLLLFVATVIAVAGHFTMFTYVTPFAAGLGVTGTPLGLLLAAYGVAAVLGTTSAEFLVGRWPVPTARLSAAAVAVAAGGLWVAGRAGSAVLGVPLLLLWGTAFALTFLGTWLAILRRVPPAGAETAGALYNIVFQVGIVLGSGLGSLLAGTVGVGTLPLVAAGAALVVLVLAVRARAAFRSGAEPA